ncbi:MAG: EFR1 family ferrodoxin [Clostridia bacterium]|nr:EFR1 family ferrodoxin [Clostridia bacterium]
MNTVIYYFSGTGNSLTTARMIADGLGDTRLVPIASKKDCLSITENAERVGFVFPIYYGNMPYSVRELISKTVFKPDAFIFSVCTYRGHCGDIALRMDQLLRTRGRTLSLSLGLPMPGNSFINAPEVDQEHLKNQKANVLSIIEKIELGEKEDYYSKKVLLSTPVDIASNFRGIKADDNCTGCGLCAMICPRNNIKIEDGRAQMGEDCVSCLACFHWCSREAIYMSKQENIARRKKYHHPDIDVQDMILQKYDTEE